MRNQRRPISDFDRSSRNIRRGVNAIFTVVIVGFIAFIGIAGYAANVMLSMGPTGIAQAVGSTLGEAVKAFEDSRTTAGDVLVRGK